jgi:hypothetical protein
MHMHQDSNKKQTSKENNYSNHTKPLSKPVSNLLSLQRSIGNRAVAQMLKNQEGSNQNIVQRSVDKSVVKDDEAGGYIDYAFDWVAADPHKSGYIVQKITRTEKEGEGEENTVEYWEAWWVDGEGIVKLGREGANAPSPNDSWAWLTTKWNQSGSLKMKGEAYFAPDNSEAALTIDSWGTDVLEAGGLKSSYEAPGTDDLVNTENKEWAWDTTDKTPEQFAEIFDVEWKTTYEGWEWDPDDEDLFKDDISAVVDGLKDKYDEMPEFEDGFEKWVESEVKNRLGL